jgi:hypothetical protein
MKSVIAKQQSEVANWTIWNQVTNLERDGRDDGGSAGRQ